MTIAEELDSGRSFDYVIVGGGTAGCVIASRLAEKLPHANILVIEGGANDFGNESILNLKGLTDLWGADEYDYGYTSVPQPFGMRDSTSVQLGLILREYPTNILMQGTATSSTPERRCSAAVLAIMVAFPFCHLN